MNIQLDRCGSNAMEEVRFKDEKASPGGTRVTTGQDLLGSNAYVFYTSVKSSMILFMMDSIRKLAILNMATLIHWLY